MAVRGSAFCLTQAQSTPRTVARPELGESDERALLNMLFIKASFSAITVLSYSLKINMTLNQPSMAYRILAGMACILAGVEIAFALLPRLKPASE
jgi:hypothetical protein